MAQVSLIYHEGLSYSGMLVVPTALGHVACARVHMNIKIALAASTPALGGLCLGGKPYTTLCVLPEN